MSSFALEVPLRNLRPSVIYSVPCDRIVQRAYWGSKRNNPGVLYYSTRVIPLNVVFNAYFADGFDRGLTTPVFVFFLVFVTQTYCDIDLSSRR